MNLDERSNQLFIKLVHNSQLSIRHLMNQYDLSRGQINYDLKKINEWLKENHLPPIERTKGGLFIVPDDVIGEYAYGVPAVDVQIDYLFSQQERIYLLEVMLLSKEEYISLNHFIDALQLSKNTVLRALKAVEEDIASYHLTLQYTRATGYYIDGDEWYKRQLLRDTLNRLQKTNCGLKTLVEFAQLEEAQVKMYKDRFEKMEEKLEVKFTDEQMEILPSFYILILRRIKKGKKIFYNFEIDFEVLADTQEFLAVNQLFPEKLALSEDEKIYLTLQLLATNVSRSDTLTKNQLSTMSKAIEEVLVLFEQSTALKIENKETLLKQLMTHMRPAYYRIKYHMNFQNHYYDMNREYLASLFYLVEKACTPLTVFFGQELPDNELFFISLFIGGHIISEKEKKQGVKREKAAIVCPNGISVSILLEKNLRSLLPEIDFLPVMSVREFYETDLDISYVFSVVPLKTETELFVINSYLTENEKRQLRKRVMKLSKNTELPQLSPEKIMAVMKKHGAIEDEHGLYYELLEMIDDVELPKVERNTPTLLALLNENPIQLFSHGESWPTVLSKLSEPLVAKKIIDGNYLEHLLLEYPFIPNHIVLREAIALPHTEAENGAWGVGMSLGIVKQGLAYNTKKIYLVVVLASNDKEKHVDALMELMNLAGKQAIIDHLVEAESEKEARAYISEFSENYWREQNGNKSKAT